MHYAEDIKQSISMIDICHQYGIPINRAGFALCPFHCDKHPSMKIYDADRGFHCFSCGVGGDIIDFTQRFFELSFMDAQRKLNNDFNLHLPFDQPLNKIQQRSAIELKIRRRRAHEQQQEERNKIQSEYDAALTQWIDLDRRVRELQPEDPLQVSDAFAQATRDLPAATHRLQLAEMRLNEYESRNCNP